MALNSNRPGCCEIPVHSVDHFKDLVKRGHTYFRLQSDLFVPTKPDKTAVEKSTTLYVNSPLNSKREKVGHIDNFAYQTILKVLSDQGRQYQTTKIFCSDQWSAHEIANEVFTWDSPEVHQSDVRSRIG